jgi:hypothetical protein
VILLYVLAQPGDKADTKDSLYEELEHRYLISSLGTI